MAEIPAPLCEVHRGDFLESVHVGHAVICDGSGDIVSAWGDPGLVCLPRSSAKMIQALPLITSGAAERHGLTDSQLALACASHQGAPLHVDAVNTWLSDLGLTQDALRCGPQPSRDIPLRHAMICAGDAPCQVHNNCSGKHAGFLTLGAHLGAGPEYVDPTHPVQHAVLDAFDTVTDHAHHGVTIDGCSAPNPATTLHAMARAMAWFATADQRSDTLSRAGSRLRDAMIAFPDHVAGEGRSCTELMRACSEPVALKTGAEGFFVAILPKRGLGIALKVADGATRASECAITALLVHLGALSPDHPAAQRRMTPPVTNWRGLVTGHIRPAQGFPA